MVKDAIAGGGLAAAILAFAAAPHLAPGVADQAQLASGLVGLSIVAAHVVASDEVARSLALKAAGVAFCLGLAGALAAALGFASPDLVQKKGWAFLMGAWLVAWIGLRVRQ